jgi:hypothetical protein
MQTAQTYRAQAETCVRQAEHAKSTNHRVILLQMAQTCLRMADEAQATKVAIEELDKAGVVKRRLRFRPPVSG